MNTSCYSGELVMQKDRGFPRHCKPFPQQILGKQPNKYENQKIWRKKGFLPRIHNSNFYNF